MRKTMLLKAVIPAVLLLIPALSSAFQVGEQPSVKYSRHNLMALTQIEVNGATGGVMEGSRYNNYGEICVYCHTPHNSDRSVEAPLWNRQKTTATFQPYSSPTMDATINQPGGVSLACLSCHDGTIAVDSILNVPKIKQSSGLNHFRMAVGTSCGGCHNGVGANDHSSRYLGTDLRNDHPISIVYNEAYVAQTPSEFKDPATLTPLKLFNGRVECATCHDVHKPTFPFDYTYVFPDPDTGPTKRSFHLRKTNDSSTLCLTCHIK